MTSHRYDLSPRDWLRFAGPLAVCVAIVGAAVWAAARTASPTAEALTPDRVALAHQAALTRRNLGSDLVFVGDSSCMMGVDAAAVSAALGEGRRAANLGLIVGLPLDDYAAAAAAHSRANSGALRRVILLVSASKLEIQQRHPAFESLWAALNGEPGGEPAANGAAAAGRRATRGLIARWFLPIPLTGAGAEFYGFTSEIRRWLSAHSGSAVDPGVFAPSRREGALSFELAPDLREESEAFGRMMDRLPVMVGVGLTPAPESLCGPNAEARRRELLRRWNAWLGADWLFHELPVRLPDVLFATPTHLNPRGQAAFSALVARAILRWERAETEARQ